MMKFDWIASLFQVRSSFTRRLKKRATANSIESLENRQLLSAVSWVSLNDGNWGDGNNWTGGQVPGPDDDVTIDPAGSLTITLSSGNQIVKSVTMPGDDVLHMTGGSLQTSEISTIANLNMSGGQISAAQELKFTGSSFLSDNSSTLSGLIRNTGTFNVTAGDPNLVGATFNNAGTLINSGATLDFSTNSTLNNLSTGLFDSTFIGNSAVIRNTAGTNLFHNSGTFRRNAAGDSSTGGVTIQNDADGILDVTAGSLTLNSTGTMAGGIFNVGADAALNFSGSSFTLTGTYTGSGDGIVQFFNGTLTPDNATFNFPSGFFNWSDNGANIANGTLNNIGFIQITAGDPNLVNATINNSGTMTNSGANLDFSTNSRLNNLSTGLFDSTFIGNSAVIRNIAGTNLFHNSGTFRRSATGESSTGGVAIQNDAAGIFDVTAGSLTLNSTGTMAGGIFNVDADAALNFSGSSFTLTGTYSGSGQGTVQFFNGTLTPDNATFNFPSGFFNWSDNGANIANGTLNNIGFIQITAGDPNLVNVTINNSGTMTNSGANLDFSTNSTLNNLSSGLFDSTFNQNLAFIRNIAGVNLFHNSGTLRRSNTGDASSGGVQFQNDAIGIIDVAAGSMTLNSSGTMQGGTFNVGTGAALNFNGSNFTLTGTYTGGGAGVVQFFDGTLTPVDAIFNFPQGFFNWSDNGANIANGVFKNTGFIQITGGDPNLNNAILNNAGTITNSGAILDFAGNSTLNNLAGALFDSTFIGNGSFIRAISGGNNLFHNAGTVRRTTDVGDANIGGMNFQNDASGVIDVEMGSITLNGSGSMQGGTFDLAQGAFLNFNGSNFTLTGKYTGSGIGQVRFFGGTLTPDNATFDFPAGLFNWSDNAANINNGILNNTGFIQITAGDPNINSLTFNNSGTITDSGATLDFASGSILNNLPGGLFDVSFAGNGAFIRNVAGNTNQFVNQGILRRSAAGDGSDSGITFSNTGTVQVNAGSITINASVAQLVGSTLTGGTWEVQNGTALNTSATAIQTNNATLIIHGNGSIQGIGDTLSTNHGTIELLDGASLSITPGFTNNGSLILGSDAVFTATSTFTQSPDGRVEFQLGGPPASGHFGKLVSAGVANLAGTAAFSFVNGNGPATGQQFTVATFPSHTGEFDHFVQPLIGKQNSLDPILQATQLVVNALKDAADLTPSNVTGSATANSGQNVSASWTVMNVSGAVTSTSSWVDSVYLSLDGTLDASDVLVARVPHTGALAVGATYTGSLPAGTVLPGVLPASYHFIVLVDSQGQMPDSNRSNNTASSGAKIATTVSSLTPGVPFNGTIQDGQQLFFRVNLPALSTRDVELSTGTAGAAELLVRQGGIPSSDTNDEFRFNPSSTSESVLVTGGVAGDFYIALTGRSGAGTGTSFTLTAKGLDFNIQSLDRTQAKNVGDVTLTVHGSQFTNATTFDLHGPGNTTLNASQVLIVDAATAYVTFPLAGVTVGSYSLTGHQGATSTSLANALNVTAGGTQGVLSYSIISPRYIRPNGTLGALEVSFQNTGDTDLPAQLLLLEATDTAGHHTLFSLGDGGLVSQDGIQLLTLNTNGPAGTLTPGASGSITVNFIPSEFSPHALTNFTLSLPSADEAIDWNSVKASLQPSYIGNAAWDVDFANFLANVGTTAGSFDARLSADANYLSSVLATSPSFAQVLSFEISQADAYGEISTRLRPGAFGTGFTDINQYQARTDTDGNVSIGQLATSREFIIQQDGTYSTAPGDGGVLTLTGGVYILTEADGTKTVFRNDGKPNFISQPDGSTVTFGYDGAARIVSITSTVNGSVVSYTYDGSGHVTAVDGPAGDHVSYTYDVTGHRTSETTTNGTTSNTYVTNAGSPALGAIATTTLIDGEVIAYSYDAQGRVSRTQNGAGFLNFSYPGPGQIQTVDTTGSVTTLFVDSDGNTLRELDANGQSVSMLRDFNSLTTQYVTEDGASYQYQINNAGDITSIRMPDGSTSIMTYGALHRILSFTNGVGEITRFDYDQFGRPIQTTFANGSTDSLSYNDQGFPVSETTRGGEVVTSTYNSQQQVTERDYPDLPDQTFTYDARGNIASITDSNGVSHFTYNANGQLTHVDYPDSSFINYTYSAIGQRTQISDSTGAVTNYQYGSNGLTSKVLNGSNEMLAQYTYDAKGNLTRADFANETATTYSYDAKEQITSVTNLAAGGAMQSFSNYTYDSAGRRASLTNGDGTTLYGYDINSNLSSVTLPGGHTTTYQYDANGNRVSVTDNGTISNYSTDSVDEYTAVGNKTFTYDLDGNIATMTQNSVTTTYIYNSARQVTGSVSPTHSITYQYNSLGQLAQVTDNGVTRKFLYDPTGSGRLLAEFDGNGQVVSNYVQGLSGVLAQIAPNGDFYAYGFDGSSNVTQLTNASGAVVNSYSYSPFGEVLSENETVDNPYKFVGQFGVLDLGTGQNFVGLRLYDPTLGRFLSPDTVLGVGMNPYTYANNQPVNQVDFTGNKPATTVASGLTTAGTVVTAGTVTGSAALTVAQKVVDSAYASKIGQTIKEGTYLAETESDVLAGASNQVAIGKSNFAKGALNVGTAIDAGLLGDYAYKFAQGDHGTDNVLNLIHSAGVVGNDILARSNNPGLKLASLFITGADFATQKPLVAATNYIYSHVLYPQDPNLIFGPNALHRPIPQSYDHRNTTTEQITPHDPNDIIGPSGPGADAILDNTTAATRFDGYVSGNGSSAYQINFENEANASAPAQVVVITDQLDSHLDWSTFELGDFSFGGTVIQVPAGHSSYHTVVDATATLGVLVDFNASLNLNTGLVTWTLKSIDPTTGDVPIDPLTGFLPPNTSPPNGDAYVRYIVDPKGNVANGAVFSAQATITFDLEAPISTPLVHNTIDMAAPTSTVTALPATENSASFTVSWSGSDTIGGVVGSGIATYDVFVSDNGGAFTPLLTATTLTSTTFNGVNGRSYAFYSVATDNLGNRQAHPANGQAITTVAVSLLTLGQPQVTFTNKQPPVVVLPGIVVGAGNLGGGTLTINVNSTGSKKKSADVLHVPSSTALGTSNGVVYANSQLTLQIQLAANVTSDMIQAFLRGITFTTKGKGLNLATRSLHVALHDAVGANSAVTETIHVVKKAPKPPRH
jgi:RHS repeat-associated protein